MKIQILKESDNNIAIKILSHSRDENKNSVRN